MPDYSENSRIRIARGNQTNLSGNIFPSGTLFYEKDTGRLLIGKNNSSGSAIQYNSSNNNNAIYVTGISDNKVSGNKAYFTTSGSLVAKTSSMDITATSGITLSGTTLQKTLTSYSITSNSGVTIQKADKCIAGYGTGINLGRTSGNTRDCIIANSNTSATQYFMFPNNPSSTNSGTPAVITTGLTVNSGNAFGSISGSFNGSSFQINPKGIPGNATGAGYILKSTNSSAASWITPPQLTSSNNTASGSILMYANSGVNGIQYAPGVRISGGNKLVTSSVGISSATLTAPQGNTTTFVLPNAHTGTAGDTLVVGKSFVNGCRGMLSTADNERVVAVDGSALQNDGYFVRVSGSGNNAKLKQVQKVSLSSDISDVLAVRYGGTGHTTLPSNCIVLGNGTNSVNSVSLPSSPTSAAAYSANSETILTGTTAGAYNWKKITYNSIGANANINKTESTGTFYLMGSPNNTSGSLGSTVSFNTKVYVTSGTKVVASSYNATSDERLKKDIQDYFSYESILDVPVKQFKWKDTNESCVGMIAQQLRDKFPELVDEGEDGMLSIKESKLVYYLQYAVNQLKLRIQNLENKL